MLDSSNSDGVCLYTVRWFAKSTHRFSVAHHGICTFWKSLHSYIFTTTIRDVMHTYIYAQLAQIPFCVLTNSIHAQKLHTRVSGMKWRSDVLRIFHSFVHSWVSVLRCVDPFSIYNVTFTYFILPAYFLAHSVRFGYVTRTLFVTCTNRYIGVKSFSLHTRLRWRKMKWQ